MPDIGGLVEVLLVTAAFAVFAVLAGVVLAVASFWVDVAAWQMLGAMLFFGITGAAWYRWYLG